MSANLPTALKKLPRWSRGQVALHQTAIDCFGPKVADESFAEELRRVLTRLLHAKCSWTGPDLRVVTRHEVAKLCASLGYFAVLGCAPAPQKILLDLDPTLAAWAVERLLGGRDVHVAQRLLRPPTELERGVLSFLLLQLLQVLGKESSGGRELALRLERLVGESAQMLEVAEEDAQYVGLGMRVQLGERLGYLRILLPEGLITGHFGATLSGAVHDAQQLQHMRRCLDALPPQNLELQVVGAHLTLTADDVANVEAGDIIVLENHQLQLGPDGPHGQVSLRLGRGLHGGVDARLFATLGEARLEVLQIRQQEDLTGASMEDSQTPAAQMPDDNLPETAGLLRDVDAAVAVELGRIRLNTAQVVRLRAGQVLRLARGANDPVDLVVGGKLFARGELIEVDGELGVRLTQVTGSR